MAFRANETVAHFGLPFANIDADGAGDAIGQPACRVVSLPDGTGQITRFCGESTAAGLRRCSRVESASNVRLVTVARAS